MILVAPDAWDHFDRFTQRRPVFRPQQRAREFDIARFNRDIDERSGRPFPIGAARCECRF